MRAARSPRTVSIARRTARFVALALALAAACGEPAVGAPEAREASSPPTEAPVGSPPAEARSVPTAAGDPSDPSDPSEPTGPAVLLAGSLAERIVLSTRVVPSPAAQTAGPVSLAADVCSLDGPEIVGDDSFTTIGPVAWGDDGALYLVDTEARIRRYAISPGDTCALTLDVAFGDGGRLTLGEGPGGRPRSLATDAAGHLWASSSTGGTDRLTGAHVDFHCDTRGSVAVSPEGALGFALFGAGPIRRVSFTDAGCRVEDWAASELPSSVHSVAFVASDRVLVTGERGTGAPIRARLYGLDGVPLGPAFGDATGDVGAPDHFCRVHGAIACGDGALCVLDGNCRELRVLGPENAPLGSLDLLRLLGLSYPWVSGLTELRDGVAYATASQARLEGGVFDGFVFRVRQL